jgi:hypothetical protein
MRATRNQTGVSNSSRNAGEANNQTVQNPAQNTRTNQAINNRSNIQVVSSNSLNGNAGLSYEGDVGVQLRSLTWNNIQQLPFINPAKLYELPSEELEGLKNSLRAVQGQFSAMEDFERKNVAFECDAVKRDVQGEYYSAIDSLAKKLRVGLINKKDYKKQCDHLLVVNKHRLDGLYTRETNLEKDISAKYNMLKAYISEVKSAVDVVRALENDSAIVLNRQPSPYLEIALRSVSERRATQVTARAVPRDADSASSTRDTFNPCQPPPIQQHGSTLQHNNVTSSTSLYGGNARGAVTHNPPRYSHIGLPQFQALNIQTTPPVSQPVARVAPHISEQSSSSLPSTAVVNAITQVPPRYSNIVQMQTPRGEERLASAPNESHPSEQPADAQQPAAFPTASSSSSSSSSLAPSASGEQPPSYDTAVRRRPF